MARLMIHPGRGKKKPQPAGTGATAPAPSEPQAESSTSASKRPLEEEDTSNEGPSTQREFKQEGGEDDVSMFDVMPTIESHEPIEITDDDDDSGPETMARMTGDLLSLGLVEDAVEETTEAQEDQPSLEDAIHMADYEDKMDEPVEDDEGVLPDGTEIVDADDDEAQLQETQVQDQQLPVPTSSALMPPPPVPSAAGSMPDPFGEDESEAVDQKKGCKVAVVSDTELAMGIWLQDVGISRTGYTSLRQIFDASFPVAAAASTDNNDMSELLKLPRSVDTVKLHLKSVLPLLELRYKNVPLNSARLPSMTATEKAAGTPDTASANMYFFNPVDLFTRLLASNNQLYQGMAHFVDVPIELYEARAWASSIRTTSGQFARYPGQSTTPAAYRPGPARGKAPQYTDAKYQGEEARSEHELFKDPAMLPMPAPAVDWKQFIGVQGGPIFPSDFVYFTCHDDSCRCRSGGTKHSGRVRSVAIDDRKERMPKRDHSGAAGDIAVRVQSLITVDSVPPTLKQELEGQVELNERFLVEGLDYYVLPSDVQPYDKVVAVHYSFESKIKCYPLPSESYDLVVRRIITATSHRPVWQASPIRGELEIMAFGRQHLLDTFDKHKVVSLPLVNFIDAFGLYRNMYRSLCGIYFIPAGLSYKERNRSANVLPFTLGPHGSNVEDVVKAIGPSLRALELGQAVTMPGPAGETITLCAFTLMRTGDMPQQQENAGMLGPSAKLSCRFCYTASTDRRNVRVNLYGADGKGRFHYETQRIRQYMGTPMTKVNREALARRYGMDADAQAPAIQQITPALDVLLSNPSDPAHSEYKGITNMLHSVLLSDILTPAALLDYGRQLRKMVFPPNWGKLQSPLHHLKSYSMSEHARWSVVVPILLRVWLRDDHLKKEFREALKQDSTMVNLARHLFPSELETPVSAVLVRIFAAVARSNMNLLSRKVTKTERAEFMSELLSMREHFQNLLEVAAKASEKNKQHRRRHSRASSQGSQRQESQQPQRQESQQPGSYRAPKDSETDQAKELRAKAQRPNIHLAPHFEEQIEEYGSAANANVFMGEAKHSDAKNDIYLTNHNNPERDLLQRQSLDLTLRFLVQQGFQADMPELTEQIKRIRARNPTLFDSVLPRSERERLVLSSESTIPEIAKYPDPKHAEVATGEPFAQYYAELKGWPVKNDKLSEDFNQGLTRAWEVEYGEKKLVLIAKTTLYWFKRFAFTNDKEHRITVRSGDFIRYRGGIGRVDEIFTHTPLSISKRRLFVRLTPVEKITGPAGTDRQLELQLYKLGNKQVIVGLPGLGAEKLWMVPVKQGPNLSMTKGKAPEDLKAGDKLIYVNWDVEFL